MNRAAPNDAAIISCDIVGYGAERDHARQVERICGLNDCIRRICGPYFDEAVVWASGGDGGHVAFVQPEMRETVIDLVRALYRWSQSVEQGGAGIPLRLTAHFGPVSLIEGADGRQQLVGDGINLCGSLLNFGTPGAVLATAMFRNYMLEELLRGEQHVRFHDERSIYLKHFVAHRVCFMSVVGEFDSTWDFPAKSDRIQLQEAVQKNRRWRVIYHAKRLLQVDSSDDDARRALGSINPRQLSYLSSQQEFEAHPLLSQFNKQALGELIDAAHLIERDDGEIICSRDDTGDAMFIVLSGQIGVVLDISSAEQGDKPPLDLRFGEGKIVGELALALQRRRTATLQAVGPTALLAINYNTLKHLLSQSSASLQRSFNGFLLIRSLEHICRNTPYLARGEEASLAEVDEPWERLLEGSRRIEFTWDQIDTLDPTGEEFQPPGIYLLAGGRLTDAAPSRDAPKVLDEHQFPLLYLDLPGQLVHLHQRFKFDSEADCRTVNIIHIADAALKELGMRHYTRLVEGLRRQLAAQFRYDVFISYNNGDEASAIHWKDRLTAAGLRVYMSEPEALHHFKTEIASALADSLVMMPFVSERAAGKRRKPSWVEREIRFRQSLFDEEHCNILPIELTLGTAAQFADGFSALNYQGDHSIEEAITTIQSVRSGDRTLPYATKRSEGTSL